MDYIAFKKEHEGKYVYYFYKVDNNYTDVIRLSKYENNDFGYYIVEIPNKKLDMTDVKSSIHNKLFYTFEFETEGFSSRGSKEELIEEVSEYIPTIKEIMSEISDDMFLFG